MFCRFLYVLQRLLMLQITLFCGMEERIHIENDTQKLDLYNNEFRILSENRKNVYPEVRHEKNIMFETAS